MNWLRKKLSWLFLLIALVLPSVSQAKDVLLSWDPSPSVGVTTYTLYWDNQNIQPFRTHVSTGNVLTYQIVNLPDNEQHWFAVTASDAEGHESVYSNIVTSPAISELPTLDITVDWEIIQGNE